MLLFCMLHRYVFILLSLLRLVSCFVVYTDYSLCSVFQSTQISLMLCFVVCKDQSSLCSILQSAQISLLFCGLHRLVSVSFVVSSDQSLYFVLQSAQISLYFVKSAQTSLLFVVYTDYSLCSVFQSAQISLMLCFVVCKDQSLFSTLQSAQISLYALFCSLHRLVSILRFGVFNTEQSYVLVCSLHIMVYSPSRDIYSGHHQGNFLKVQLPLPFEGVEIFWPKCIPLDLFFLQAVQISPVGQIINVSSSSSDDEPSLTSSSSRLEYDLFFFVFKLRNKLIHNIHNIHEYWRT